MNDYKIDRSQFIRSVVLDSEACMGCTHCMKRCPTNAIRILNGKAMIINKFCIDCGVCIRKCPHHAKIAQSDSLEVIADYKYTVALPAPTLYAQYNNIGTPNTVLNALKKIGFDDVYEVSAAAEIVSEMTKKYIADHQEQTPYISTACPSVVRLIRVRFPALISKLLPIKAPVEVAAEIARKRAVEKTGLPAEDIGIIFISPCPAKVSYAKSPLGVEKSNIDKVVAIKDIYPLLLPHMTHDESAHEALSSSGRIGTGWASSGGESAGINSDSYLAADGMTNIIKVLENLEDEKFSGLDFIELNACSGGCVGGTLNVENPYVSIAKLKKIARELPYSRSRISDAADCDIDLFWNNAVDYQPVYELGSNFKESLQLMRQVKEYESKLPQFDCGCCGSPTCNALAIDIVKNKAELNHCIFIAGDKLKTRLNASLGEPDIDYSVSWNDDY